MKRFSFTSAGMVEDITGDYVQWDDYQETKLAQYETAPELDGMCRNGDIEIMYQYLPKQIRGKQVKVLLLENECTLPKILETE